MFDYVDANGDGAIDLKELKAAMKKHQKWNVDPNTLKTYWLS